MADDRPLSPGVSMARFLGELGCRKRGTDYLLDEFSCDFYLRFDAADDPDTPDAAGTVDIYVVPLGAGDTGGIRVTTNCTRHKVMRFLFSLDVSRFSERTRKALYASNTVLRAD